MRRLQGHRGRSALRPERVAIAALVGFALASGCQLGGPRSLQAGRGSYNTAIQQTSNEQLLLNLVRLRYVDTPLFLEVSSVTTQMSIEAAVLATGRLPVHGANALDLEGGIEYAEQPTITYTPLQGDRFARQLLAPLELSTLVLLYRSGWPISPIFRVCVQRLNQVRNAPTASGPTPDQAPEFQRFLEVSQLFRALQLRGVLELGEVSGRPDAVHLQIAPKALDWPEVHQLTALLDLEGGHTEYPLTTDVFAPGRDRIVVVPRSLLASLFFLSQGVVIPEDHARGGYVTVTRLPDGSAFDWGEVTGDLIRVRASHVPPRGAHVSVPYRDTWFSIRESDVRSKTTFALLTQLFALQAGRIESRAPILTLPMSR